MDGDTEENDAVLGEKGVCVVRDALKTLPDSSGVYRMISEAGEALYVGKAKSLKKRVRSYTLVHKLPFRLQRMVALTASMEFICTHTEAEALLLESNLIKKLKPRYNILLRDDKSFPYILITGDHDFPTVVKHRGAKKQKGQYYGPFASAGDVNRTIAILQRVFMLRNCSDNYFANRSRPCLQYHIKRCTAPCVDLISIDDYAQQVSEAKDFLDGKSHEIQERFADLMQKASESQNYEQAAHFRDRVKALTSIQAQQDINLEGMCASLDVMALAQREGQCCIQVFFFRGGRNHGNRAYYPRHDKDETPDVVLAAFMAQFYENKPLPKEILVNVLPEDHSLLEEAFTGRVEHKVSIRKPARGNGKRVVDFAVNNALSALGRHLSQREGEGKLLQGVAELFDMDETPRRIEVYDNSHVSGTNMVGGMIVAGEEGFIKGAYRKFNIREAGAADDYAMMREVMQRRFKKVLEDGAETEADDWPDILLIDGGLGQYNAVAEVLEDLGILDKLLLVSIAKGEDRNAGREQFFIAGRDPFRLPEHDLVLHYLQRLRDEAHRFAIGAHRTRRAKQITASPLDDIPGIGAKRKKALLLYFGSAKAVASAGKKDLQEVEGISEAIAQNIYDHFH